MEQHSAALCAVAERARAAGCAVAFDAPMARHTTMRVGGAADLFVTAPDAAGACAVLSARFYLTIRSRNPVPPFCRP